MNLCLSVGLIPFNTDCTFNSKVIIQRETLLSLCLEQHMITFLVKCAREWSDGSASYLFPTFIKWAVQRATSIKQVADHFCICLFDHSRLDIDESEIKIIRFCCKQLEWLSHILSKLPMESADLTSQQQALKRVSTYLDVLLWFYDFGLLPEFSEQDYPDESFSNHILYPYSKMKEYYQERREETRRNSLPNDNQKDYLFIDEFITREFPKLREKWQEESSNDNYPPSSLQSLLRMFLFEFDGPQNEEMNIKHQIMTYFLIDIVNFHYSCPDVEQLIKYPLSFKVNPSLIKLVQSFYLLDHKDYVSFREIMDKFVSNAIMEDWHHRLIIKTLLRDNQHSMAMNYLRVRRPPLSSLDDEEILIDLTVKHGLVNTAFHYRPPSHYSHLLTCFFKACKNYGKLGEILHLNLNNEEEEAFTKFLEQNECKEFRLLYNVQRCHYLKNQPSAEKDKDHSTVMKVVNAYHATLPDIVKRFRACADKMGMEADNSCSYLKPLSHSTNRNKSRDVCEILMEKTQEFNKRINGITRNYVPFVSAPSASLKSTSNMNVYCIEYPERKIAVKRKLENNTSLEEDTRSAKRRKSDTEDVTQLTDTTDNGTVEVSMRTFTSTPLVKRCDTPFSLKKNARDSTPQSILKIRQLIRKSSSLGSDSTEENRYSVSQEKTARQIRFRFSRDDSSVLSNNADDEKVSIRVDEHSFDARSEGSTTSNDVNYGPRPRPSLRSRQSNSTEISNSNENLTNTTNRQSLRYSLNNTAYMPSILSSTTDVEFSVKEEFEDNLVSSVGDSIKTNLSRRISLKRSSLPIEKTTYMSSFLSSDTDYSFEENKKKMPLKDDNFVIGESKETDKTLSIEAIETISKSKLMSNLNKEKISRGRHSKDLYEISPKKYKVSEEILILSDTDENIKAQFENNDKLEDHEPDESFISVTESLEDQLFQDTMTSMSDKKLESVANQNHQPLDEFNITDDESIQIAENNEEKDDENNLLDVNITDDESNDSLIFSKKKSIQTKLTDKRNFEHLAQKNLAVTEEKSLESVLKEDDLKIAESIVTRRSPLRRKSLNYSNFAHSTQVIPVIKESKSRNRSREKSVELVLKEDEVKIVEPLVTKRSPLRRKSLNYSNFVHSTQTIPVVRENKSRSISREKSIEPVLKEDESKVVELSETRRSPLRRKSLNYSKMVDNTTQNTKKEKKNLNRSRSVSKERSLEPVEKNVFKEIVVELSSKEDELKIAEQSSVTKSPSRRKPSNYKTKSNAKEVKQKKERNRSRSASKEKSFELEDTITTITTTTTTRRSMSRAKSETREKVEIEEENKKTVSSRKQLSNKVNVDEVKKNKADEDSMKKESKTQSSVKKPLKTSKKKLDESLKEKVKEEETMENKRILRSRSHTPEKTVVTKRFQRAQSVTADTPESSFTEIKKTRSRRAMSVTLDTVSETEQLDFNKKELRSRRAQSVSLEDVVDTSSLRRTRSSNSLFKAKDKVIKPKRVTRASAGEIILEETFEETANEVIKQIKANTSKQKRSVTRKKKVSESSCNDGEDVQFEFSLPDAKDDMPTMNEGQISAEKFEFSPPHTRSRHPSRRK